jgi:hypothetical protein
MSNTAATKASEKFMDILQMMPTPLKIEASKLHYDENLMDKI